VTSASTHPTARTSPRTGPRNRARRHTARAATSGTCAIVLSGWSKSGARAPNAHTTAPATITVGGRSATADTAAHEASHAAAPDTAWLRPIT
jgi:hypothetical protein